MGRLSLNFFAWTTRRVPIAKRISFYGGKFRRRVSVDARQIAILAQLSSRPRNALKETTREDPFLNISTGMVSVEVS